jgi:hypothetical protein
MFHRLRLAAVDQEFLNWVADLLVNTYHEDPESDYLKMLRNGRGDKDFMNWIAYRLIRRHGERTGAEFVQAIQKHAQGG